MLGITRFNINETAIKRKSYRDKINTIKNAIEQDLEQFEHLVIYNPRRENWNSSWVQNPTDGTPFHEQVVWELDHLESSDMIVFYFADDSKSPITLLELGLFAPNSDKRIMIYCSSNFYRCGNVKIVADRYQIPVFDIYEKLFQQVKTYISHKQFMKTIFFVEILHFLVYRGFVLL